MERKLVDALAGLARDPKKLAKYMVDPHTAMGDGELGEDNCAMPASSDVVRINARLKKKAEGGDMPPVVEVSVDALSASMTELAGGLQAGSPAGLTLFPNQRRRSPRSSRRWRRRRIPGHSHR